MKSVPVVGEEISEQSQSARNLENDDDMFEHEEEDVNKLDW
jgi:hypothetical protein